MKPQVRALLIVAAVGALIVGIYLYLSRNTEAKPEVDFSVVEQLEKTGITSFAAVDLDGKAVTEKDFAGKVVILNFWASWCTPCVEEIPSLAKMVQKFGPDKVLLIAVSGDDNRDEMKTFLKSYPEFEKGAGIRIVWMGAKEIMKSFEVDRLPESFIFDRNQKLKKKVSGSINWMNAETIDYIDGLLH